MSYLQIFFVQFSLSLLVYSLIAKWYVAPWLAKLPLHDALIPLLFLHAFRFLGLVFLLPGFVGPGLPEVFVVPTAYGDLLMSLLALLAIIALRSKWKAAIGLVWLANIVGVLDFIYGNYHGIRLEVQLGAAYYIPILANPAMWVSHFMIFWLLLTHRNRRNETRARGATR